MEVVKIFADVLHTTNASFIGFLLNYLIHTSIVAILFANHDNVTIVYLLSSHIGLHWLIYLNVSNVSVKNIMILSNLVWLMCLFYKSCFIAYIYNCLSLQMYAISQLLMISYCCYLLREVYKYNCLDVFTLLCPYLLLNMAFCAALQGGSYLLRI